VPNATLKLVAADAVHVRVGFITTPVAAFAGLGDPGVAGGLGGVGFGTIVESLFTGPGAPVHAVGHDADALKYCTGLKTI
jgi:hypothetical protein